MSGALVPSHRELNYLSAGKERKSAEAADRAAGATTLSSGRVAPSWVAERVGLGTEVTYRHWKFWWPMLAASALAQGTFLEV